MGSHKKEGSNSCDLQLHPKKLFDDHDSKPVGRSERRASMLEALPHPVLMDEIESEKLVARMLEIVSKEKNSAARTTSSSGEEENDGSTKIDEKRVDEEIEEKEEILGKLMDTVKGYSALKADYEKLMDEISTLDCERRELEAALQAQLNKPQPIGGPKNTSVEKLQERFKKVNEELQKMRADRSRKEMAYKNMQRESKQCEQLSKELYALKSVKVSLQKKQKEQAQLHLKFKKEQQAKLHQLKKSEVKKQQAMNDLKNELTKKQRVLGHKDRELSRMQSKLKACEEHITQLLRIQTVNRGIGSGNYARVIPTKTPGKQSSASHADEVGSRGSFAQTLSAIEYDHYVSSKSVLDNLVSDRVERKELAASFELKSNIVRELEDEVSLEKGELRTMQNRLDALEKEHAELLANNNVDEAEDVAVDIMKLEQDMEGIQADVDGVKREIDMHVMDLTDISTKMAQLGAGGLKSETARPDSTSWEELGKNVITGLTPAQSQVAVWELLQEKADALAKATELQEKLKHTIDVTAFQQDSVVQYEKQIQVLKEEARMKLQDAEKRRVHDVWALMKAQSGTDVPVSSPSVKGIADEAAKLRAQELETALEECLTNEEVLRAELEEYKASQATLETEIMELRLQQDGGASGCTGTASGGYYSDLKSIWDKLGTNTAQRAELLDRIEKARTLAKDQVHAEYQEQILSAKEEELRLVGEIEQMRAILGLKGEDEVFTDESVKSSSLLGTINALHTARSRLLDELEKRALRVNDIQRRLVTLISHMELDVEDPKLILYGLNRVVEFPSYPFDDEQVCRDDDDCEELLEIYINKMSSMEAIYDDDSINRWSDSVKVLSVERARNVDRCNNARTEASATARLLGFQRSAELAESIDLGDLSNLSECTLEAAFDAVFDEGFHPLGSAALADLLERINLVLKSIDINRRTVMKALHTMASKWNAVVTFNGDVLEIPLGVIDVSPSMEIMSDLFLSLCRRWKAASNDIRNFVSVTRDIINGLSLSTEDQVTRQSILESLLLQKCKLVDPIAAIDQSIFSSFCDKDIVEESISSLSVVYASISGAISDLEGSAVLVDEIWIKKSIRNTVSTWESEKTNIAKVMLLVS